MKILNATIFLMICFIDFGFAQVGIGTIEPAESAILELNSQNKGLLIPRMNQMQRDSIELPAEALMIYNLDDRSFDFYSDNNWQKLLSNVQLKQQEAESIDTTNNEPTSSFTLGTNYTIISTDSITIDRLGTIEISSFLNIEPPNNCDVMISFSTGSNSYVPTSPLSKHSLNGNQSHMITRTAFYEVTEGQHVFNAIVKLDPTPNFVTMQQYFSQMIIRFHPS